MKNIEPWPAWKIIAATLALIVCVMLPSWVAPCEGFNIYEILLFILVPLLYAPFYEKKITFTFSLIVILSLLGDLIMIGCFLLFTPRYDYNIDGIKNISFHPLFYVGYLIIAFIIDCKRNE